MKKAEMGKFRYGDKSRLSEDDLEPENTKTRITTFVSGDIIEWLKREAKAKNVGYQTLLDMKLREMMEQGSEPAMSRDIRIIRDSVEGLVSVIGGGRGVSSGRVSPVARVQSTKAKKKARGGGKMKSSAGRGTKR